MHWIDDWAYGLPLIILTLIGHTLGLFSLRQKVAPRLASYYSDEKFSFPFALVMGVTVLAATLLIAIEAGAWATVYVAIGALPDFPQAMLYSLEAMTTFGHADVMLTPHWQFLGALEALNGVILIGLTTAFIFSVLHAAELNHKRL
jgi:hypothetical protein